MDAIEENDLSQIDIYIPVVEITIKQEGIGGVWFL